MWRENSLISELIKYSSKLDKNFKIKYKPPIYYDAFWDVGIQEPEKEWFEMLERRLLYE